jgi:hypothetical protein
MHTTFIHELAVQVAQSNAESWDIWRGDCDICGTPDTVGFCDRCTECAIDSIFINEREYGGTTESVLDYLGITNPEKYPRILDYLRGEVLDIQSRIWRNITLLNA